MSPGKRATDPRRRPAGQADLCDITRARVYFNTTSTWTSEFVVLPPPVGV